MRAVAETTFADLHRASKAQEYDDFNQTWLPPFLVLDEIHPCEKACCWVWVQPLGSRKPIRLHARRDAAVQLIPRQTAPTSAPSELAALTGDRLAVHGADTGEAL